jgi:hypothetical protein
MRTYDVKALLLRPDLVGSASDIGKVAEVYGDELEVRGGVKLVANQHMVKAADQLDPPP